MQKNKFIFWAPRMASMLFIAFLALFSLDIFDGQYGFWGTILGLFMHNIPVFILAGILWVAWKREIVGAVAFILAGLLYIGSITMNLFNDNQFEWYMVSYSFIIAGPAFFIGILFLIGWHRRKSHDPLS